MTTRPTKAQIMDSLTEPGVLAAAIKNNGISPYDDVRDPAYQLTIHDTVFSNDLGPLLPQAVVEIMVEAQEPLMTLSPLMDRIQVQAGITEYKLPATGVFDVERIGEGESYPEKRLNLGGSMSVCTVDKWGVALSFTEEAISASRWDLVGWHAREAGRAFGRRREVEAAEHFRHLGQPVFDNRNPTRSLKGTTNGRSQALAQNGTITLDDLFEMYAQMLHSGYRPDILIMHPLTWLMFIKDPILRAFAYQNGGGVIYGGYTGNNVNRNMKIGGPGLLTSGNKFAGLGAPLNGAPTPDTDRDFNKAALTSAPQISSMFPYPLRIVVTPMMWYDAGSRLTDIIMADSSALGAFVDSESLYTASWEDIKTDIKWWKFRERWGIMMYEEGMGVVTARNIKVDTNFYSSELARPTYELSTLPAYAAATPIV